MFRPHRLPDGNKKKRGSELTEAFRYIHSAVFWFLTFFYTVIIHTVSYVIALFIKDEGEKNRLYQKGARLWGSLLAGASLIKVNVSGLENIPAGEAVIFTPNHQSYLDIFILLKYLPHPFRFVIMRKLFNVPLIGSHITQAGFISLDSKDRKRSIKTIHLVIDILKNNESFVIFPEGKLTRDGSIGEFGRGTSIIIQRSMKPVVPIAIDGTFNVLPKGAWTLKTGRVNVRIGKPVYFERYYGQADKSASLGLGNELRRIVVDLKGQKSG
ncbi:MAG: 1-acyl-sn-glycerol-3-phosphate acyltransferase [Candidatus Omnitrophica bacterium]|nr:1-acyl-sn-glycerol-3-phosphate acyltransferase [Candidatus Omnitrophota bacterium]